MEPTRGPEKRPEMELIKEKDIEALGLRFKKAAEHAFGHIIQKNLLMSRMQRQIEVDTLKNVSPDEGELTLDLMIDMVFDRKQFQLNVENYTLDINAKTPYGLIPGYSLIACREFVLDPTDLTLEHHISSHLQNDDAANDEDNDEDAAPSISDFLTFADSKDTGPVFTVVNSKLSIKELFSDNTVRKYHLDIVNDALDYFDALPPYTPNV